MRNSKMTRVKTGWILALLLILTAILPGIQAEAASSGTNLPESGYTQDGQRVVTVGYSQVSGLMEVDSDGKRSGIIYDYLIEISKYTNWVYEFVDTDANSAINGLIDGNYELLGGTYYEKSLESYFSYPNFPCGSSKAAILARKNDDSIKSYDLNTLSGKTIGVFDRAAEKIRRLKDFLSINAIDCTLKSYSYDELSDDGNLYRYLLNGDVDLLLGDSTENSGQFKTAAIFDAQPYYIVTNVGNEEILTGLNMALEKILDANPDFTQELYEAYYPDSSETDIQLSKEEKEYIAEKKTIKVAAVSSWHPFYCAQDTQEQHDGIVTELLQQISGYTGLEIQYIYADSYAGAIDLVKEGKADLLGCYMNSEQDALGQGMARSSTYMNMNNIVVKNKAVSYPGEGLHGAVIQGSRLPDEINAETVEYYRSAEEGIRAVEQGKADFYYGLSSVIEKTIQRHHFSNIIPVSLVNHNAEIAFAVPRPVDINLLTILNKGISSIPQAEKDEILRRNLVSIGYSAMTLKEMVYNNPFAFITIFGAFLIMAVLVFLSIARARMKNSMMQSELEKAEAESRAKGEFLSRMSHEIRTPMNAIVGLTDLTCLLKEVPEPVEQNLKKIQSSSQYLLSLINDILDMSRIDNGMLSIAAEDFSLTDMLFDLVKMMEDQAVQRGIRFLYRPQIRHEMLLGDSLRLRQILLNLLSNAFKFTPRDGEVILRVEEKEAADGTDGERFRYFFSVKDTGIGVAPEDQKRIFGTFEQVVNDVSKSAGTGLGLPISRSIVGLMGGSLELKSEIGKGSEFYFTLEFPGGTEREQKKSEPESAKEVLTGKKILLAEDNDLNAEIAVEMLQMQGALVERAVDGQDAVSRFVKSGEGYYQVILMDIQMPVKNGLEAAREIRVSDHPNAKSIPIIAMTANSFKEDTQAAKTAGMNGFVSKPVDFDYLYRVIAECLENRHEIS